MRVEYSEWLSRRTWSQIVRFCKVIALLIPLAAVAIDWYPIANNLLDKEPVWVWMIAWHLTAELVCIAVIVIDKYWPEIQGREYAVNVFSLMVVALSTWMGIASWFSVGDFSIYALGLVFVATVVCTPRHIRRPMYFASAIVICAVVALQLNDLRSIVTALTNPLCVAVVCFELDKYTYERNLDLFNEKELVEAQRQRADKVLYNVLPLSIADELKKNEKVNAVKFENMGVMFADIVGFTNFSKSLPPDALIFVLNQIFSTFDELVDKYGLEKIKTIGDAYMVVSTKNTLGLTRLALDMILAMDRYNISNGTEFRIRIGLHVGPTVAGVIGIKRFLYDVWGDTVNVASRMESTGEAGKVHVTEEVSLQIKGAFRLQAREPIEVKGKGLMSTYFVVGELEPAVAQLSS